MTDYEEVDLVRLAGDGSNDRSLRDVCPVRADTIPIVVAFPTIGGVPPGAVDAAVVTDYKQVYLVGITRDSRHHGIRRNVCPVRADTEPIVVAFPTIGGVPPRAVDATVVTDYEEIDLVRLAGDGSDDRPWWYVCPVRTDTEPIVVAFPTIGGVPPRAVDAAVVTDYEEVDLVRLAGDGSDD